MFRAHINVRTTKSYEKYNAWQHSFLNPTLPETRCQRSTTLEIPSFRSKKIFSQRPIPIVPAALPLFTLFPSPSRLTAFWSFAHKSRSRSVEMCVHMCACARACVCDSARMWVCALGAGGILISIQSRTISPAQPLKDEDEGFPRPLASTPMTQAGWISVTIFRMFAAKPWENYVNRGDSHNMSNDGKSERVVGVRKGRRKRNREKSRRDRSEHIRHFEPAETERRDRVSTIYLSVPKTRGS